MKYKAGDKILCSVNSYSLSPSDHFTFTVTLVRAHDYEIMFKFHSEGSIEHSNTFDDNEIEIFSNNYITATSPLNQALS